MRDHHRVTHSHEKEELLHSLDVGRDTQLHALQTSQTHVGQLSLQGWLQGQVLHDLLKRKTTNEQTVQKI
jgi:hypothetical protein